MTSWREKLCGTLVQNPSNQNTEVSSLQNVLKSNAQLSCGGGFLPNQNTAHLKTNTNVILPTEKYAVMILKTNGSAVIYSEDENLVNPVEDEDDKLMEWSTK